MPKAKQKKERVLQIKVILRDAPIPIWRRFLVTAGLPLELLHGVLQIGMGWSGSHLHCFRVGKRVLTDTETAKSDSSGRKYEPKYEDESEYDLQDIASKPGDKFVYEYDFGDCWLHEIEVEKVHDEAISAPFFAHCLAGKRACPPEDVGGVSGYASFLEAIEDPEHPAHEDMSNWIGCVFDADSFDARYVNREIMRYEQEFHERFAEALTGLVAEKEPEKKAPKLALVGSNSGKRKK